jgi:DNA-binding NarL/FixJ family response regulator
MLTLKLDQEFIDAYYELVGTLDSPELEISVLLADLAWQRERAGRDLRHRWNTLSHRQQEIALLVYEGKTYPEIARALGLSLSSVRTHASVVYKKMGVKGKFRLRAVMLEAEVLHEYLETIKTRTRAKIQGAGDR